MKYFDGQHAEIGDVVDLGGGMKGTVRIVATDDAYDANFLACDWAELKTGLLIESEEAGLVHYPDETSASLVLISRRSPA